MSKRKTTNIPEVEISAEILKTIERDYNIGVYENIIDVSAYNNNNVDNANNDDNGDDNYEGVNFNDNSEINDSNVEDVYSQTSPSKNMDAKRNVVRRRKYQQKVFENALYTIIIIASTYTFYVCIVKKKDIIH